MQIGTYMLTNVVFFRYLFMHSLSRQDVFCIDSLVKAEISRTDDVE